MQLLVTIDLSVLVSIERSKAELTRQQQIGLKHFDDLVSRMTWSEADLIKRYVEKIALEIKPDLLVEGCGSYRYNDSNQLPSENYCVLFVHSNSVVHFPC